MKKSRVLLVLAVLSIVLAACYFFLTQQVDAGRSKVTAGEVQLAQGEQALAKGKEKLASGKETLSQVNKGYKTAKTTAFAWASALPVAGGVIAVAGNKIISQKIAAGKQEISKGNEKVQAGEAQVNTGKSELAHGIALLNVVNIIRIASGIGSIFFVILFVALGLRRLVN